MRSQTSAPAGTRSSPTSAEATARTALVFRGAAAPRLAEQLLELGVADVHVIARGRRSDLPEGAESHACEDRVDELRVVADLARAAAGGGIALVNGDVVASRAALEVVLAGPPGGPSAILGTGRMPSGAYCYGLRVPRARVLAAASPYHWVGSPNAWFAGVLRVAPGDEAGLAEAADRVRELLLGPLPDGWAEELERKVTAEGLDPAAAAGEIPALLLTALVRGGVPVMMRDVRSLAWARPLPGQEARGGADDDEARLDAAVKSADGFFTTFFVSPYSKYIARWAARRGITPNQVTTFSMGIGVLAATAFAVGHRWGLIAGALLLQAAFTFDCVDGQLARYTRCFSRFGAWLDSVFDRLKEYLVYAGLAIGSTRTFGVDVWPLAAAALSLQTARHMIEFAYWDVHYEAIENAPQPPLEEPGDRPGSAPSGATGGVSAATLGFSRMLDRPPGIHWLKKMAVLPIGERFAAISISAAVATPRTTFVVLLVWGGVAAVYSVGAHVAHSVVRGQGAGGRAQPGFRDDGPLALGLSRLGLRPPLPPVALTLLGAVPLVVAVVVGGAFLPQWALLPGLVSLVVLGGLAGGRPDGRFDWATPGILRALEYGLLLWMAVLAHGPAVRSCFALLAVLAFHHYDSVYRLRQGRPAPAWLNLAGAGWDGRLILAYVALVLAASTAGMALAAGLLTVLYMAESASGWLAEARSSQPPTYAGADEGGE
jgi:uncharacterized protein DUF5941/CDP-alcohol phosphatidyltransferase-like enzyme